LRNGSDVYRIICLYILSGAVGDRAIVNLFGFALSIQLVSVTKDFGRKLLWNPNDSCAPKLPF